ncbi:MAG: tRNA pseudouridine(55) synthase TruB [Ruminococcus sp.]|nr:tRNA pseudouridine(55) synthase TruB [Ruminococcus sp.]
MAQKNKISGVLPVYKPEGWTSFDVVAKLRGITGIKKIGHGGTLDPMAAGVLPVFLGRAARACDIMPDDRKRYIAGFRLGETTDTLDITGRVTDSCGKKVSREDIETALAGFVGDILQVPPMYSAIKVNGKKLYELARAGETIEPEPREITVDEIKLTQFDEKSQTGVLVISCRKGTYVRALIRDIALKCGTFGVMTALERTFSGGFSLDECFTIAEITEAVSDRELRDILLPTDKIFDLYEDIRLGAFETRLYKNGVRLRAEQSGKEPDDRLYRVYGFDGEFLGLGRFFGTELGNFKSFFEV